MEVWRMSPRMRVLQGALEPRQRSGLEAAYEHFRLERQGDLVSPATLENYDYLLQRFLRWLASQWHEVRRFDDLKVAVVRAYRAELTVSKRRDGRPLAPHTILDTHRVLLTFFRWARAEGYSVDPRIIELKRPRVPDKEPTRVWATREPAQAGEARPTPNPGGRVSGRSASGSQPLITCGVCEALIPTWRGDIRVECQCGVEYHARTGQLVEEAICGLLSARS